MELHRGNCLTVMDKIETESIDLVVTSPPYDNLRKYRGSSSWSFSLFESIAVRLVDLLKQGGAIVWVVGDATINGSETGTSMRQALFFKKCGLSLHDTMIYAKNNVVPLSHNRYEQAFEYMFVLSKGRPRVFNGIKDKKNKYAGDLVHGTQYTGDTPKKKSGHNRKTISEFGLRHNIFYYNNQGDKRRKHPAVFPLALAEDMVASWSNPSDLVMDPFMGSGTVGEACIKLQRNFIGIEIDKAYFDIAKDRITNSIPTFY